MPTYTLSTNAMEERALTLALEKKNHERSIEIPPKDPLTMDKYLDQILLRPILDNYKAVRIELDRANVNEAYALAPKELQEQVRTLLGV